MKIKVLHPGISSSFQDLGRLNGLAHGIPRSGAMDLNSLRFCNSLLGNPQNEACIEFALLGPKITFNASARIAITGGDFNPFINDDPVQNNTSLDVNTNDILSFRGCSSGVFGYIGFKGSIDVPLSWGSKSAYSYADLGLIKKEGIQKGDEFEIKKVNSLKTEAFPTLIDASLEFRLSKGPEYNHFPESTINNLVNREFTLSNDSNRMGYRIEGELIESTESGNIISSGTIPGTIQLPKSGVPIVLMADSPCTGGYPRIAIMNKDDMSRFAQVQPGQSFSFKWEDV